MKVSTYVTSTRHELETRLSWISSIDTAGTASLDKAEKAAIGLGDALVALGRYVHVNRQALFKVAEEFDSVHGALAAPRLQTQQNISEGGLGHLLLGLSELHAALRAASAELKSRQIPADRSDLSDSSAASTGARSESRTRTLLAASHS